MVVVVSLLKRASNKLVKRVSNEHVKKFPTSGEVFKQMSLDKVQKLDYGSVFCDSGAAFYGDNFPVLGHKPVYSVLSCKLNEYGHFYAIVQLVGIVLIQQMHEEKIKILSFEKENQESPKHEVVTMYFDKNYIDYYPETLPLDKNYKKAYQKERVWDLNKTNLFSFDEKQVKHLIPKKAVPNCQFKVK